ncbi:MAG: putative major capsid protein [Yellowstone Lake virophage 6]|uniref:putative major capsid protein n=1 Tax=Yellowstone Lake virophage 6 TaxID=1557034 RepID=UPI000535EBFE|nr:MAG: putative major capsid protein [Yellowstone Lake virophage 6]AIW01894.1 MAG: putative major capsid protein [Yellowstone Lake virophage 6]
MSDLKTVLINDSRIEDISGEIGFSVLGGPQQSTFQPQQANTSSNTSHSWQINVPSENIVVDRRILLDTDVAFTITITNVPVGQVAFNWGKTDGFGPYPLNNCYLTQNVLINNCGLSVNTQDIIAPLLRLNDQKIHTYYDGWTPSMVDDTYYNYSDAVDANNNPIGTVVNNSMDNKMKPRGCHTIKSMLIKHYLSTAPLVIADASVISTNVADTWTIDLTTHFTEPLLFLSPFISNPCVSNEAGFLGINNFSFNFTIDSNLRRVFRTSNAWTNTYSFTNSTAFTKLQILMNYLSVQPSQYAKISARNVLPLLQYDRYIANSSNTTANIPPAVVGANNSITLTSTPYTSSNIALNQIPDTILIFGRIPVSSQTAKNSDAFYKIDSISINFNNVAGILSSATPHELWVLSQKAGSSQSWDEFSGQVNTSSASGASSIIPTTGSILVLSPSMVFNLPEYLSSSSLGSYNLQFTINLSNQSLTASAIEIVVVTITSGYITTHQGTTQSFTGVLNKEMVMSAKEGSAVPRLAQSDYERLVGGVRDNRGVMNMMKQFKNRRMGSTSGGVMSGGVMSGGMQTGSRLGKYIR